jgi:sensor histidine kinase regulating citrate/malate metabolism
VIRSRQDETQQVLVSVTDYGVGIPAENADRLFNAFFTTKSNGMGMGSAVRSWKPTVAGCGPRQTPPTVLRFSSPCR